MTTYEKAVYEIICTAQDHPTAEQVCAALRQRYPGAALATVYNNLNRLTAEGLIRRVAVEGAPVRYDRAAPHDHIVCPRCGALRDIRLADLTEPLRAAVGEELLGYDLRVFSLCPACRAKAGEEEQPAQPGKNAARPERRRRGSSHRTQQKNQTRKRR